MITVTAVNSVTESNPSSTAFTATAGAGENYYSCTSHH